MRDGKLVYSTDPEENQRCPRCKNLRPACVCVEPEPVRAGQAVVVKLRLEKGGRGGKAVTVLYDLPRNPEWLRDLAGRLKRQLGTGGTAKDGIIELQGDYRERLRTLLPGMGFRVKG